MATDPTALTPDLSKAARRELGLSQADVIQAAGIPAHKLKQWEARGMSIELRELEKLASFYESQGADLDKIAGHVSQQKAQGAAALPEGFTVTPRAGFAVAEELAPELVQQLTHRLEENDKAIAVLVKEEIAKSFFGDISEATDGKVRELFGKLAMNHLLFRLLQGRNLIQPIRDEPKTVGDLLTQWVMRDASAAPLLKAATVKG